MAIKYGFFNSVGGDRKYNADDISNYFLKLISNGVFATPATTLQVTASDGLTVRVLAGWGFINCKWLSNDAPFPLTLDAADLVLDRIDRIVLRMDPNESARNVTIAIKKGRASATPTPPDLTRQTANDGGIWELSLAQIAVNHGTTQITDAEITDERANTDVCGYVTGLIDQIDTTNLFAQYNAAFAQWFETIKTQVKTTTIIVPFSEVTYTDQIPQRTVSIGSLNYNDALDILEIWVNGMRLIEHIDYTVNTAGRYVTFAKPLTVIGTVVEVRVLKAMDTDAPEEIITILREIQADVAEIKADYVQKTELETRLNGLSLLKIAKVDFDALTAKDPNTIYFVVDGNKISIYMGEIPLSGGSALTIGNPVGQLGGVIGGAIGAAEEV